MSQLLQLCRELISRPSVTPNDAGCQRVIAHQLEKLGFTCDSLASKGVDNLWATRGQGSPVFCFAGHTDVVPSGPEDQWTSMPFSPQIRNGKLFGRGAADMKGSIAAMLSACEQFIQSHPDHYGTLAFLITSDEEGEARHGTRHAMRILHERGIKIDHCLVGEPSSSTQVGDLVRIGRRGSLHLNLKIIGLQGHVAYPEKSRNPIHLATPALTDLCREQWDQGNQFFPPTTFQISNINSGTGANNVVPGEMDVVANFRFSTAITAEQIQQRVEDILRRHELDYASNWQLSGEPFLSQASALTSSIQSAIKQLTDQTVELSTGGGTSDGRFIAPYGTEVVELGPVNASIHQIDEYVDVEQLELLQAMYLEVCKQLLTD